MEMNGQFQGVVCCNLKSDTSIEKTIIKLLDLKTPVVCEGIRCFNLELKNKYYGANIHLFDFNVLETDKKTIDLFEKCSAIILYGDGTKTTPEQLDTTAGQLSSVKGDPRVLLCEGSDENTGCPRSIQDWCLANGYDMIYAGADDAQTQVIDSLSAYKWKHVTEKCPIKEPSKGEPKLGDELMKKLADFDSLLAKINAVKDTHIRGNPNDESIMEIAEILSGLMGEDGEDFLEEEKLYSDIVSSFQDQSRTT